MSNTNKERCKNCEDVEVGSIIEVEKDGRTCSFCGRDIHGFRIDFKASDTEESLKKAYESAVPSQDEQVIQEGLARVYGKVCEVEDTQLSGEWEPTPKWILEAKYKSVLQIVLDRHEWDDKYQLLETIIEGLLLTERSKLVELLENAVKDIHGGGNGRRIIEQVLAHLKSNLK